MTVRRKSKKLPLHGARIEDYAVIGDCETAALVSREGSIDWLCLPTFSSAACFAALLGTADHGYWKIAPAGKVKHNHRAYAKDTMVVETTFETSSGTVLLTDFMPSKVSIRTWSGSCGGCVARSPCGPNSRCGLTMAAPSPG